MSHSRFDKTPCTAIGIQTGGRVETPPKFNERFPTAFYGKAGDPTHTFDTGAFERAKKSMTAREAMAVALRARK